MAPFGLAYDLYLRTHITLDPPNGSLSFQTPPDSQGPFGCKDSPTPTCNEKLQSHFYKHTFSPQFVLESST